MEPIRQTTRQAVAGSEFSEKLILSLIMRFSMPTVKNRKSFVVLMLQKMNSLRAIILEKSLERIFEILMKIQRQLCLTNAKL